MCTLLCSLTDRFEQANSLSAWVDGSQIYGLSLENATALRDPRSASQFGRGTSVHLTSFCLLACEICG